MYLGTHDNNKVIQIYIYLQYGILAGNFNRVIMFLNGLYNRAFSE